MRERLQHKQQINKATEEQPVVSSISPLQRSGQYARRAAWSVRIHVAASVAVVGVAVATPIGAGLEPGALIVFLYLSALFWQLTWSFEWPRGDPIVLGFQLFSFALLLVPTVFGPDAARSWDIRLVTLCFCAVMYWYMVWGQSFSITGGGSGGPLNGKVYLITGCNAGIGLATAEELARAGARVIFACRSEARAREAMAQLLRKAKGVVKEDQLLFIAPLDLSSHQSIKNFVTKFRLLATMRNLELHVMVLNAGAMFAERKVSEDGIEMTFAANHLGHFLLTHLLLPQLKAVEKRGDLPRVVILGSSQAFGYDAFDFSEAVAVGKAGCDAEEFLARPYNLFHSYGQSKLANCLFATGLVARLKESGSKICVCVVHPGCVRTEITKNFPAIVQALVYIVHPFLLLIMKTVRQGCMSIVYAATSTAVVAADPTSAGRFVYVDRICEREPNEAGRDPEAAERLWSVSERLVGINSSRDGTK
eukprot:TRINITY_DN32329_c0_g1_i1.p1 TRINITY_DN32329_c0_g1~~TRINITY_DN32329_c0_g1_i1.p1  ORF type:complete len:478 (-),score=59.34 TRINITY_DN32329_c0_g1_i1:97-1530(-)